MKKTLILAMLSTVIAAGCAQDNDAATGPAATPEVAASAPARDLAGAGSELAEPLPEGVRLAFANRVRSDAVVERGEGRYRRRIGLDYLDGDQESTYKAIANELLAAGFRERERADKDNGNIRSKFDKPKFGTVVVTVTPDADGKRRVLLDWPASEPRK